ncbi:MAG: 2-oxopent-4-enoate hydratase, partial [Desulfarculaceae bacterium]
MEPDKITQISQELIEAYQKSSAIAPLTEQYPDITIDDAYQIQTQVTQSRLESGARIVGKKIGLTSQAMMDMFKVHEPDYGALFDDQMYLDGCKLDRSKMIQPRIEAEIAFLINKDLKGPSCTAFQVLDSTSGILASLEIIDSRISDWKIKIQDTVADNASCWGFVVSPKIFSPLNLDLRVLGLAVYKNGDLISTAAGA